MSTVPVSPDGKYHYFIGFVGGPIAGGAPVATDWPILATGNAIDVIRDRIAEARSLPPIVITSIGLLAAPIAKDAQ